MKIVTRIRRLSYSPIMASFVRKLGLRDVMRRTYVMLRGEPGLLRFSLHGTEAAFQTRTPVELRTVEAMWFSEQETLSAVLANLQRGDVFLDVGSNLGIFSVFAANRVGPGGVVLAFEPETRAHAQLGENIQLNNLQNVRVHKIALSDTRTTRRLLITGREGVSQSSRLSDGDGDAELVETTAYDSLAAEMAYPVPKVVKMDIEGHEFLALKGMQKTLSHQGCKGLYCEVHPGCLPEGVDPDRVVGLVRSLGFSKITAKKRGGQIHVFAVK